LATPHRRAVRLGEYTGEERLDAPRHVVP